MTTPRVEKDSSNLKDGVGTAIADRQPLHLKSDAVNVAGAKDIANPLWRSLVRELGN